MNKTSPIKRALISVYDKSGLCDLAAFLRSQNVLIMSSGGTAAYLRDLGHIVTDISAIGHFPEILDGRVKTLNPRIYAGILFDRAKDEHVVTLSNLDIPPIDLVVGNLYPFGAVSSQKNASIADLIANIDIGGPAMIRAAAKNHPHVVVLHDPEQYADFISHYQHHQGTTLAFREQAAVGAFSYIYRYDQKIAQVLADRFAIHNDAQDISLHLSHERKLRYGENPHQLADVFSNTHDSSHLRLTAASSLGGKVLSFNNLLDAHAAIWALRCLADHQEELKHYAIVIKHGVPCGAAMADHQGIAIAKAIASDERSAFGGIIATSSIFDESSTLAIKDGFFELVIAPSFTAEALAELRNKKNLRLLPISNLMTGSLDKKSYQSIFGGLLAQDHDTTHIDQASWTTVTKILPTLADRLAMNFAFRMVKATPSNAITIATREQLLGVGAGQPNRIQAAELAIFGAKTRGSDLANAAMASDAFFPFADCIELAHRHGIRLVIQPGGSIRDQEIIHHADALGMCMVFTHRRHFKH